MIEGRLSDVRGVDIFLHDSLHTFEHEAAELAAVGPRLTPARSCSRTTPMPPRVDALGRTVRAAVLILPGATRGALVPGVWIGAAWRAAIRSSPAHGDLWNTGSDMQAADMDGWRWWRQVLVRGSGFPANGVLRLANEGLAHKADSLADADRRSEVWRAFCEKFHEATVDLAVELQSIASQDDFLRAVTWQNHRLVDSAIRPFQRWDPTKDKRNFRQRQREELIASYWQRYCVKNDTIGFFGPSGWGHLGDCARTRFAPGERLLRSSEVFFEAWAIDRLAEAIEEIPRIDQWLMPRRLSFIKLDGDALVEAGRAG